MWPRNARRSKSTAGVGGTSGMGSGRRIVLIAGLTCIVGTLLWLGMRIARIMALLTRIEISTAAVR
jgi:hypothetical protein